MILVELDFINFQVIINLIFSVANFAHTLVPHYTLVNLHILNFTLQQNITLNSIKTRKCENARTCWHVKFGLINKIKFYNKKKLWFFNFKYEHVVISYLFKLLSSSSSSFSHQLKKHITIWIRVISLLLMCFWAFRDISLYFFSHETLLHKR